MELAVGSEEDPGAEQAAGGAGWRGTDDGFVGDVLEASAQLDRSEEAECWARRAAGQVLPARSVRGSDSGAVLDLAWAGEPHCSQLPALPARSHHPLGWSVLGTADRFLIRFRRS